MRKRGTCHFAFFFFCLCISDASQRPEANCIVFIKKKHFLHFPTFPETSVNRRGEWMSRANGSEMKHMLYQPRKFQSDTAVTITVIFRSIRQWHMRFRIGKDTKYDKNLFSLNCLLLTNLQLSVHFRSKEKGTICI